MKIKDLIKELQKIQNKDYELTIAVNGGNPENESDDDDWYTNVEIFWIESEYPSLFVTR